MRAAALSLALFFALSAPAPAPVAAQTPVPLTVTVLPLNPEDRTQERVGQLVWRGGIAVSSEDASFGGLSDLVISPDGRELTAITDQGRWLTARLSYDAAGYLSGMTGARMGALRGPRGLLLTGKAEQDAEALTRLDDGSLVAAFERDHRLLRYPGGNLAGLPQPLPAPPDVAPPGSNQGLEALVALGDGRLLAFTEGQRTGANYAAYLREIDGTWQALALKPSGLFLPTGAAQLPDGDILLLERRYTFLGGPGARLSRIPLASLTPGAVIEGSQIEGREIAELRRPLTLDNFEGVAVHQEDNGSLRLTLVSDDNFSPLQRTLVMQFEWVGE